MLRTALPLALLPAAALAHSGPHLHLHPHGAELPIGALLVALGVATLVAVALLGRR